MEEKAYRRILVWKPLENLPYERLKRRQGDDIVTDLLRAIIGELQQLSVTK
jgi:hypothetical protein